MVDRPHAVLAGAFVLLLGLGVAVLASLLRGRHGERLPYVVISRVPVAGLSPQSIVYFRGVPAGAVKSIEIGRWDARQVEVHIELDTRIPVTHGTFATLRSQLVTGNAQLMLDDDFQHPGLLPTRAADPARLPLRPTALDQLSELAPTAAAQLTKLARSLEHLVARVEPDDVARIVSNGAALSGELRAVALALRRQLAGAPGFSREAQRLVRDLRKLAEGAGRVVGAGEAAGRSVLQTTLPRLNAALEGLRAAARSIDDLAQLVREQPDSLVQGRARPPPGPGEAGYRTRSRAAAVSR